MKDRYILVALLGTKNNETGEFPNIPLFAKAGDLSDVPSFARKDISDMPETPDEKYLPAGIMGVFDPETKAAKPIQLYADTEDWISLSKTASEHLTGGIKEERERT